MSRTDIVKRGPKKSKIEGLTDQQWRFVQEYIVHWNGAESARIAGYANPGVASSKLLKNPTIQRYIASEKMKILKSTGIRAEEAIMQLWYALTRTAEDFADEEGKLITDVSQLNARARASIDGIEQTVTTYTTSDGDVREEIKTKLKLIPKAQAIDMAMKHKGLFEEMGRNSSESDGKAFDWNTLYGRPHGATLPDEIELKKLEEK